MKIEYNPENTTVLKISSETQEDKEKLKQFCEKVIQEFKNIKEK